MLTGKALKLLPIAVVQSRPAIIVAPVVVEAVDVMELLQALPGAPLLRGAVFCFAFLAALQQSAGAALCAVASSEPFVAILRRALACRVADVVSRKYCNPGSRPLSMLEHVLARTEIVL